MLVFLKCPDYLRMSENTQPPKMSQRKTLSKPYAYVRNPVWIETAV
jgi:hypothetical protein